MWPQTIRDALTNLAASRQRTLLALIGIVIGAASVIAMLNIGATAQNEVLSQFRAMGIDILSVSVQGGEGGPAPTMETFDALRALPGVRDLAPIIRANGTLYNAGVEESATLAGVTASLATIAKLVPAEGRFISDLDGHADFIVLGFELHKRLSRQGPIVVGQVLRLEDRLVTVVGILAESPRSNMIPLSADDTAFVPALSIRRLDATAAPRDAVVRINADMPAPVAVQRVEAAMQAALPGQPVRVYSAEEMIRSMEGQMQLFTLLLGSVGAISLIVGGVGVMNVMLVSVVERRREIGIRLALGTKRRWITRLFLVESVVLSVAGGIIGGIFGTAGGYVAAGSFGWVFTPSAIALPLGIGVSILIGVFFGYYPARQAARLDPIVALRSD